MDGWMGVKAGLRIAYSNQKLIDKKLELNYKDNLCKSIHEKESVAGPYKIFSMCLIFLSFTV